MAALVKQGNCQWQHNRQLGRLAGRGGGALLGADGIGVFAGIIAGGYLKLGCASLVIPEYRHELMHFVTFMLAA